MHYIYAFVGLFCKRDLQKRPIFCITYMNMHNWCEGPDGTWTHTHTHTHTRTHTHLYRCVDIRTIWPRTSPFWQRYLCNKIRDGWVICLQINYPYTYMSANQSSSYIYVWCKLQVIFRKRANYYRALLRKMTYKCVWCIHYALRLVGFIITGTICNVFFCTGLFFRR